MQWFRWTFLAWAVCFVVALPRAAPASESANWSTLEYDRSQAPASGAFLYVPRIGPAASRGAVLFRDFKVEALPPAAAAGTGGSLLQYTITVKPAAVADGSLERFLVDRHLTHDRLVWHRDPTSLCTASPELTSLLPPQLAPSVLGPAYPHFCKLRFRALPEDRAAIDALIAGSRALAPPQPQAYCSVDSPVVRVASIVDALISRSVLSPIEDNAAHRAIYGELIYESSILSTERTEDFGGQDYARQGWREFMRRLIPRGPSSLGQIVTIVPAVAKAYVCMPMQLNTRFLR